MERAALSLNQSWVPAVENRGEGVFLAFDEGAIQTWLARPAVKARGERLLAGFDAWKKTHPGLSSAKFPGLPYVMLHSLSHLLITAVSLDCGYAASSIRERIYVGGAGHGILLYTASPDAEGTLGGLVQAADRIDKYLVEAVELGKLCANDPVCAQHRPGVPKRSDTCWARLAMDACFWLRVPVSVAMISSIAVLSLRRWTATARRFHRGDGSVRWGTADIESLRGSVALRPAVHPLSRWRWRASVSVRKRFARRCCVWILRVWRQPTWHCS